MAEGARGDEVTQALIDAIIFDSEDFDILKVGFRWGLLFRASELSNYAYEGLTTGMYANRRIEYWSASRLATLQALAFYPEDGARCQDALTRLQGTTTKSAGLAHLVSAAALAAACGNEQAFMDWAGRVLAMSQRPDLALDGVDGVALESEDLVLGLLEDPRPFIPPHVLFEVLFSNPFSLESDQHVELCVTAACLERMSGNKTEKSRSYLVEHGAKHVGPCLAPQVLSVLIEANELEQAGKLLAKVAQLVSFKDVQQCQFALANLGACRSLIEGMPSNLQRTVVSFFEASL